MLKSRVRMSGQLMPSCALYMALRDTNLNIRSEQNATAVSKATFIKTY